MSSSAVKATGGVRGGMASGSVPALAPAMGAGAASDLAGAAGGGASCFAGAGASALAGAAGAAGAAGFADSCGCAGAAFASPSVGSINATTLLAYAYDKKISGGDRQRVPERVLHGLALVGGTPAALAGRLWLRHKTQKRAFLTWFWVIAVLQAAALGAWLWLHFR